MKEQTPLKKLTGTVTFREDKDERRARIGFKPDGSDEAEFYDLWRTNYQTKLPNPCDSKCVKGAHGTLVLRFRRGKAKVAGDPSQGFYPDSWEVFDIDLSGSDHSAEGLERATPVQRPVANDRERRIEAQSARKDAAVVEAALIVSMGHEKWLEEGGYNRLTVGTLKCMKVVDEAVKNPLKNEPDPAFDPFEGE